MIKIDNQGYIKEKTKEMKLYTRSNIEISDINPKTLLKLIYLKRKFQAKKISNYIAKTDMIKNTNINHIKGTIGNFEFNYEYQRYDMKIKQKDFLKFFYNCEDKNYDYFFTNCGMSALYSCFSAFTKLGYKIERLGHIYVEIERMLDDYILKNKSKKKVAYIDTTNYTSLIDLINNNKLNEYYAFIIDTTDYLGDEILPIIDILKKYKKLICLIRSHIKLDMLGAEWSKLGSVCLLNEYDEKLAKKVYNEIDIILSVIGGYAYPEDISLIWNNKNFKEINKKRIKRINENSQYLYNQMLNVFNEEEIVYPYHKKFILLKINFKYNVDELDKRITEYIEKSKYKGLINFSDSFGLDYYSMNGYWESMDHIYPVIRISVPDFPKETNKIIVKELVKMSKKMKKEMGK